MNPGSVDPIIGLDVPSKASPIDTKVVENPPMFNPNFQEQTWLNQNQESKLKLQERNKLSANKKSLMTIILDQCDKATRADIALSSSYEDNFEAGELIKFLARVHTVCDKTNDGNVLFGSWVTKITEHHFQPTPIIKKILSVHSINNVIWDNTDPCNMSFDIVDDAEITTSIHIPKESTYTCCKFDP